MTIDVNSGSFIFQSLQPADLGLYTYNANGQFIPVSVIIVGNVTINTTAIVITNPSTNAQAIINSSSVVITDPSINNQITMNATSVTVLDLSTNNETIANTTSVIVSNPSTNNQTIMNITSIQLGNSTANLVANLSGLYANGVLIT